MKFPSRPLVICTLLASLGIGVGSAIRWTIKSQKESLPAQEQQDRQPWVYGDFVSTYFQFKHQLERVLLTHGNTQELIQLQRHLALFKNQIRPLLNSGLVNAGPKEALLRSVIQQDEFGSEGLPPYNETQYQHIAHNLDDLQEFVGQLAMQVSRADQETVNRQRQKLQKLFLIQNTLTATLALLIFGALGLWLREKKQNRAQILHYQDLEQQLSNTRRDLESFNQNKQALLTSFHASSVAPLNSLILLVEDQIKTEPAEKQTSCISMRDQLRKLQARISELLEIYSLEAGFGNLQYTDFDLHGLLSEVSSQLLPQARAKSLLLSLEITTDVPIMINGADARLRQIMQILIENAIKHTHTGRIRVNAYTAGRKGPKPRIRIDVSDTGIGIEPTALAQLFQPNHALVQGDTPRQGVRLARILARHQQGDLSVASRPGDGTTFTLDLPLRPSVTAHSAV